MRREGEKQLEQFMALSKLSVPVVDYRKIIGEFASASAVAAALAVSFLESGIIPGCPGEGSDITITNRANRILVLGLGHYITAMALFKPLES